MRKIGKPQLSGDLWTDDELIVVLTHYLKKRPLVPDANSIDLQELVGEICEISNITNVDSAKTPHSAESVRAKLCDFRDIDPDHSGRGRSLCSERDKGIWNTFVNHPGKLRLVESRIKARGMTKRFTVGDWYTRNDIYAILGVPPGRQRGDWLNGYHKHNDEWFVFASVGTSGRTGHDYNNYWDDLRLHWTGKAGSHLDQPSIRHLIAPSTTVHVFWRSKDRAPFTYAGEAKVVSASGKKPVAVVWAFPRATSQADIASPDEVSEDVEYREGAVKRVLINAYERSAAARQACIEEHGLHCAVCGFDFEKTYGDIGRNFIHVHHVIEIAITDAVVTTDPKRDLRPVCPNCHAMLHRHRPCLSVEELRDLFKSAGQSALEA